MDKIIKVLSLKEKLDEIDAQVVGEVFDNYYESRLRILIGMWEKGEAIYIFRGGKNISYGFWANLERETRRDDQHLKRWHDLYETHPSKETYIEEVAEPKAKAWTEKVFEKERGLLAEHIEPPPLPEGKYRVLYADPPWQYSSPQHTTEEQETVLETHYPTMTLEEIGSLPIKNIAHEDSVLFLWITSPLIFQAKEIIVAWGFEYKANFIWDKIKHNVGYYNSVRHELLLIATCGFCLPDSKKLHDSVVSIERTEHSRKPEYFRRVIDKMYIPPKGRNDRIELFARDKLPKHWDSWGNE